MLELLRTDQLDCAYASVDPDALGDDPSGIWVYEEVLAEAFLGALAFGFSQNVEARLPTGGRRRYGCCVW